MGFVAVTVGFTALGAYLGRDLGGGIGLVLFLAALAAVFGLNAAAGAASSSPSCCCSGSGCCSGSPSRP